MESAYYQRRAISANQPDVVVKYLKDRTCKIIDVAVPENRNVIKNGA